METPLSQSPSYPPAVSNPFLHKHHKPSSLYPEHGIKFQLNKEPELVTSNNHSLMTSDDLTPKTNNSSLVVFGESHPACVDQCNSSSNNSPFQSAAEDQDDGIADGDRYIGDDRDPLLFKGPPRQSVFHKFLSSAKGAVVKDKKIKLGAKRKLRPVEIVNQQEDLSILPQGAQGGEVDVPDLEDSPSDDEDIVHQLKDDQDDAPTGKCSIGILLAAVSCVFFATSSLIVKVSRLHPMELLFVRGALQALFISPIVLSSGNSFLGSPGSRALLLARAVLGSVSLIMSFASIHLIPLADAATCIFTSPVFVSLFACICLGELCSWFDVSMIMLTLLGVILVSQPSFNFITSGSWTSILGTICGLAAAMLTALAFIILRQLKHVHYSVTVLWFSVVLAGFGAVLMIALDGFTVPGDWSDVLDCVGIGVCGFLGQILLTKALQIENAGPCAVARTLDIVLAFFYQITLLHDTPDWYSYLGSFLVVSCVLLTAFRRWYREKFGLDVATGPVGGGGRRPDNLGAGCGVGINSRNYNYTRANTDMS